VKPKGMPGARSMPCAPRSQQRSMRRTQLGWWEPRGCCIGGTRNEVGEQPGASALQGGAVGNVADSSSRLASFRRICLTRTKPKTLNTTPNNGATT
jgi:hypothetical protein